MITTLALALAAPQNSLAQPLVAPGGAVGQVVFTDLDGDGQLDALVLTLFAGERIWVHRGTPSGLFEVGIPLPATTSNGIALDSFQIGDADGDGHVDVVGGRDAGDVFLWRGDGAGGFDVGEAISPLRLLCVGDVDGDGTDDVLVGSGTSIARLIPSTSNWGVAPVLGAAFEPVSALLEDLDGDGDLDLGYCNGNGIARAENDGAGNFVVTVSEAGVEPFRLTSARLDAFDQDGDGTTDLVMGTTELVPDVFDPDPLAEITLTTVDVLFGGGASPAVARGVISRENTNGYAPIDVDGDGDRDLVLTQSSGSEIALASAAGGYTVQPIDFDGYVLDGQDLDGDGVSELVSSPREVSLAWSSYDGSAVPPALVDRRIVRAAPRSSIDLIDLDLDGELEVVGYDAFGSSVVAFTQDGNGGLADVVDLGAYSDSLLIGPPLWLDADSDGDLELASMFFRDRIIVRDNLGAGQFEQRELFFFIDGPIPFNSKALLAAGDFDGDGDDDIAVIDQLGRRLEWYRQGPGGTFSHASGFDTDYDARTLLAVDLDGDGADEILIDGKVNPPFNPGPYRLRQFNNDGAGSFAAGVTVLQSAPMAPGEIGFSLTSGDVDGDGHMDVFRVGVDRSVVTSTFPNQYGADVFLGSAAGTLSGPMLFSTPMDIDPLPRALADVDGDGVLDVVGLPRSSATQTRVVWWYRGVGDGTFGAATRLGTSVADLFGLAVGDLDGDGDRDVVVGGINGIERFETRSRGEIGIPYCGETQVANSSGQTGRLRASGSASVQDASLLLEATQLPPFVVGLFVTGNATQSTPIPNSIGRLCVGGDVARFVLPGQIQVSDVTGAMSLNVDLGSLPSGTGFSSAIPGTVQYFQAWHRDLAGGAQTSNLTEGVAVLIY